MPSFTTLCFALFLLSGTAFGTEILASDPNLVVTCTRDQMTIVATAVADDDYSRIDFSVDTGDKDQAGTDVTLCPSEPALTLSAACGDDTGPCESTLLVDLTVEPLQTDSCGPNTKPADETEDPQDYTKLIQWRKGNEINTDTGNEGGGLDNQPTTTLITYRVTCRFPLASEHTTEMTPQILIDVLNIEVPDPVTVAPPQDIALEFLQTDNSALTGNPVLGQSIRLAVSFTDDTGYWQHLVVTKCIASAKSAPDGTDEVDFILNSCPQYTIDTHLIVTGFDYPAVDVNGVLETKRLNVDFRAFRVGNIQQLYMQCDLTICPDRTQATHCTKPTSPSQDLNVDCTNVRGNNLRRYKSLLLGRSSGPETFTSTLSTVIVLSDADRIIVDSNGNIAAGYTCLTTATFAAVVSILCLLCLISVAITVTVCLQSRGRSANKAAVLDLPMGYNNYSVSKQSLNA